MEASKPLVVDLDGTLLKSDMLWESLVVFIKSMPWLFYQPIWWLCLGGKCYLKTRLAQHALIDIEHLPFDTYIMSRLTFEKNAGRKIILATATHETYANNISQHLGLFDEVLATNASCNLSGKHKKEALVKKFGAKGYDYIGNSFDDLYVWQAAEHAFLVNPPKQVQKRAEYVGNVKEIFNTNSYSWKSWPKALRLHQWLKNLLVFIPLLAAHQILSLALLAKGILAFLLFGLCASGVYLLNDLFDLHDDRQHLTKKNRPFASGAIPIQSGLFIIPFLFTLAFIGAWVCLPSNFLMVLFVYCLVTLAYSLLLKRIMMLDVVVLAGLYTLRIIAGIVTFNLQPTFWMLAFSMFIFMSLALVKRYAELIQVKNNAMVDKTHGREYFTTDLEMIASLGAASGYLSVLILALYVQDQSTTLLYHYPKILWLACPLLLFWISRTWMLTHRGLMHDDPVIFAMKDKISLWIGSAFLTLFWLAT